MTLLLLTPAVHGQEDQPAKPYQFQTDEPTLDEDLQQESEGPEQASTASPTRLSLNPYAWIYFPTDLRGVAGHVRSVQTGITLDISHQFNDQLSLNSTLGFEYSDYEFGDADPFTGGSLEPFDSLWQFGALVSLNYRIDEQWSIIGAGFAGFGFEDGANLGDSVVGGGALGVGYVASQRFRIIGGISVRTLLEDNPLITPLIVLVWQFDEKARLETINLPQGFGLTVITTPIEDWEFAIFGGWQFRQWRLNSGGPPVAANGVFRDSNILLGGSITWTATPQVLVSLRGGATLYRDLELLTSSGSEIQDIETDPGAFLGLRLEFRF